MVNSSLRPTRAAAHPISVLVAATLVTGLSSCGTAEGPTEPEAVVASVAITNGDQSFSALGGTVQLSAVARDANGNPIASASVQWASSAAAVVSVSNTGLATAIANGSADITATASGISASVSITVAQVGTTLTITSPPDTVRALGLVAAATAHVLDANGNALPDSPATWSSSDTQVLVFTEDGLEAVANGTAVLSASIGSLNGTLDVVVAQSPASIVLAPTADTLRAVTDSIQLTPTMVDANGFAVVSVTGVWSSAAPGVASVSTSGWVSAVGDGIAEIAYTAAGVAGTASITVNLDQVPATLSVAVGMDSLFAEGALIATATLNNADGFEVIGVALDWTVSDPSVTVASVWVDTFGRSTARLVTTTTLGTFSVQARDPVGGVVSSTGFTVTAAPTPRGISIDFEADANGTAFVGSPTITDQFSPWGITFHFVDVFVGGGTGGPILAGTAGTRFLNNDRKSIFESLTGSHLMTFSVDVARIDLEYYFPPAAFPPPIRAYDRNGEEIPGIVVEKVLLGSGWTDLTVWSPVLVRSLKIGKSNGYIYMDPKLSDS